MTRTPSRHVIDPGALERYLTRIMHEPARVVGWQRLGSPAEGDVKAYGYGKPLLVEYRTGEETHRAVISTISPGSFGHQHMSDRAQALLWGHKAFNTLPRHVQSLDVGAFTGTGEMIPLGDVQELFGLVEFVEGEPYANDLRCLRDGGRLTTDDLARADALCDYLIEVHARCGPSDPSLYRRHVRELIGHGECIMGLVDSYPDWHGFIDARLLARIEQLCVEWRWRLHDRGHRLRRRHGDFHPWNILFANGADFRVLDRSRGEWGDPADDVVCLTMNYLFFALQQHGRLAGGLGCLWHRFWDRYLTRTGDTELLEVAAPYIAFRALVMASPVWYPSLDESVRRQLFDLMLAALTSKRFDPEGADALFGS